MSRRFAPVPDFSRRMPPVPEFPSSVPQIRLAGGLYPKPLSGLLPFRRNRFGADDELFNTRNDLIRSFQSKYTIGYSTRNEMGEMVAKNQRNIQLPSERLPLELVVKKKRSKQLLGEKRTKLSEEDTSEEKTSEKVNQLGEEGADDSESEELTKNGAEEEEDGDENGSEAEEDNDYGLDYFDPGDDYVDEDDDDGDTFY